MTDVQAWLLLILVSIKLVLDYVHLVSAEKRGVSHTEKIVHSIDTSVKIYNDHYTAISALELITDARRRNVDTKYETELGQIVNIANNALDKIQRH